MNAREPRAMRSGQQPAQHLPPHDVQAEEAVIAALLLDEQAIYRAVGTGLQPADFYDETLGGLYRAAIGLGERGVVIDPITLADAFGADPGRPGDMVWLAELPGKYFTAVGFEAHARMVMRDASYRRMIATGQSLVRMGFEGGPDAEAAWRTAGEVVLAAGSGAANPDVLSIGHYIEHELPTEDRVLYTAGFRALDRHIRGVAEGEVICVGARTDAGKTAMCVGMAYRQARAGVPVAIVPLEGSVLQVMHRMAAIRARVSIGYATRMGWMEGEEAAYYQHFSALHGLPIYFPDQKRIPRSVHAIAAWITRAARGDGVKVAYIDHIDAISLHRDRNQSGASAYAEAMRQLQELAGRERIAVVFASQVNREARNADLIPPVSLLRESGSKEEASQTVLMLGTEASLAPSLEPERGRYMHVRVAKLKDYPGQREITAAGTTLPVLYLDERSGAVREIGEQV